MATDYYSTLGVGRNASQEEIQKAYRDLARKYHPDLNPDDEASKKKFQEVQSAFDVLGDEEERKRFDRYGSNYEAMDGGGPGGGAYKWPGPGGGFPGGGFPGGQPGGQNVEFDLSDLFGNQGQGFSGGGGGGFAELFKNLGGGAGQRTAPRPSRGADIEHEITVPFNTAVTGGEAALSVQRANGNLDTIKVKIPIGIEDGKKIRLRGQGEQIPNGTVGDILLTVRISPHPFFQRRGKRLDVRLPVTIAEAVEGAKVDVPTPQGTISLSIPPGTSSGSKLRIKGHGVAPSGATGAAAGDLYAEIQIMLPPDLSEEERTELAALSRKLSKKHSLSPRSDLRW